jgi:uncharacterized protein with PIN domain
MLGYDVTYMNSTPDDVLLKMAREEERALLTRDAELFRRASVMGLKAIFVKGRSRVEQLADLAKCVNIKLEIDTSLSRCPLCNSPLHNVSRDAVLEKVPSGTLKHHEDFWLCSMCGKVYWRGKHWTKIMDTLNKANELLEHTLCTQREDVTCPSNSLSMKASS